MSNEHFSWEVVLLVFLLGVIAPLAIGSWMLS